MKTGWAGVMALAVISMLPSACMAQYRDRSYGYERQRDSYRVGYDRGFEEGARHGRVDGHRRERYAFRDERAYRRGDSGYRSSYGSRSRYTSGYREGFERGYRRAFDVERRSNRSRVGKDDYYDDDYAVEKDNQRRRY